MVPTSRRLRAFRRWMRSQGVEYGTDAIEFIDSPPEGGGIAVKALRDLKEGEVVATIPKTACLTIKTSGARRIVEAAGLCGYLGLSVALMYERSLGHRSPWAGYLQLLPDAADGLPLLWTLDEVDHLLRGTELHKIVKEDKGLVYEDWKENILPLVDSESLDPKYFGVEQYFAAKSLIASRSFEIDDYHGFGMVPLADLFNHKTGAEDVHFTSLSSQCGSDDADESNKNHLYANYAGNEELSSETECSSNNGNDHMILEMIMVKDVRVGVEIFNTYGLIGNAALLHRYGFAEADNPYDIVNIDLELVLRWSSTLFSDRYGRARLALWRRLGYSGCVTQNAEYFEISPNGEPQVELLILLYIILLKEDTFYDLDLKVSTASNFNGLIGMILSAKCSLMRDESSEISRDLLLTKGVCCALFWLADERESAYGLNLADDDIEAIKSCTKDRKLFNSLVLRVSERKILQKLRAHVASSGRSLKITKRTSTRKRLRNS